MGDDERTCNCCGMGDVDTQQFEQGRLCAYCADSMLGDYISRDQEHRHLAVGIVQAFHILERRITGAAP